MIPEYALLGLSSHDVFTFTEVNYIVNNNNNLNELFSDACHVRI